MWHRLNLLIFRACKLQLIYYASCCGGGPLGKLCVWESRFWYSASTLDLFSDFVSRLLESWIGTFLLKRQSQNIKIKNPKQEKKTRKQNIPQQNNNKTPNKNNPKNTCFQLSCEPGMQFYHNSRLTHICLIDHKEKTTDALSRCWSRQSQSRMQPAEELSLWLGSSTPMSPQFLMTGKHIVNRKRALSWSNLPSSSSSKAPVELKRGYLKSLHGSPESNARKAFSFFLFFTQEFYKWRMEVKRAGKSLRITAIAEKKIKLRSPLPEMRPYSHWRVPSLMFYNKFL